MRETTQQEKLMSIGISMLALGIFPLIWFLSQALLFRNLLVVVALIIGSSFIFLLFLGMDKIIKLAPKDNRDALEARMFVGPSLFMISLFLFYPAVRTIYISFKDRYSKDFIGFEKSIRWQEENGVSKLEKKGLVIADEHVSPFYLLKNF